MVTLNCDMGEAFGLYQMGDDAALMPLIDDRQCRLRLPRLRLQSHAHDGARWPSAHGVKVGAHPSLPDLQGFGRREMKMSREELANCLIYQIGALKGFLDAEGMTLNHIKPHGSLYGMASRLETCRACGLRRRRRLPRAAARHDRHAARDDLSRSAAMTSSPSSTPISTIPTRAR